MTRGLESHRFRHFSRFRRTCIVGGLDYTSSGSVGWNPSISSLEGLRASSPRAGLLNRCPIRGRGLDSPSFRHFYGAVAESLMAPVSKTGSAETHTRVKIPPAPPSSAILIDLVDAPFATD